MRGRAQSSSVNRTPTDSRRRDESLSPVHTPEPESPASVSGSDMRPESKGAARGGMARHTMGMILLLIVVVLWTTSNFLASTILADDTYSKPFFVTYVNTSFFIFPLMPIVVRRIYQLWKAGKLSQVTSLRTFMKRLDYGTETTPFLAADGNGTESENRHVQDDDERNDQSLLGNRHGTENTVTSMDGKLGFRETAKLSFQFCLLWFAANYFALACLQFTTVGSTTILTSTSGVWTLIFGAVIGVEKFTIRKLLGVLASLAGIFLISRVDLSDDNDDNRGSFPHKTPGEIALGDTMAGVSAVIYGVYTIVMKKQVGDESRVNMQLFFGLVGLINTFMLWPGFLILHFTGFETFALPPTGHVWMIITVNSLTSLVSDICWAYAMLLTTPLVVTVGLSLTIPLSLIGQIFLHGQYSSALYWIGAAVVFFSFIVVNHEGKEG